MEVVVRGDGGCSDVIVLTVLAVVLLLLVARRLRTGVACNVYAIVTTTVRTIALICTHLQ